MAVAQHPAGGWLEVQDGDDGPAAALRALPDGCLTVEAGGGHGGGQ
jgi:hypothetical protein